MKNNKQKIQRVVVCLLAGLLSLFFTTAQFRGLVLCFSSHGSFRLEIGSHERVCTHVAPHHEKRTAPTGRCAEPPAEVLPSHTFCPCLDIPLCSDKPIQTTIFLKQLISLLTVSGNAAFCASRNLYPYLSLHIRMKSDICRVPGTDTYHSELRTVILTV